MKREGQRRSQVALLAEGVDRNVFRLGNINAGQLSPSSRRAWIEIRRALTAVFGVLVALLAEGVDRNTFPLDGLDFLRVALLAEGVDRNLAHRVYHRPGYRRPPRGGRG